MYLYARYLSKSHPRCRIPTATSYLHPRLPWSRSVIGYHTSLLSPLSLADPEAARLIAKEQKREAQWLNLLACETYPTAAVIEASGSEFTDTEGYPERRFHNGKQYLNEMEELCCKRALETFDLSDQEWGVNIQALSGSLANLYTFSALLDPSDVIMGLDMTHGGHISHGYQTPRRKVSQVARQFTSSPYLLDSKTGLIDYDCLAEAALRLRPKMIIAGSSAYARNIDYARMRDIADKVGAYLHADFSQIAGLVAAGVMPSPFPIVDTAMATPDKSFRGPRGAMIWSRKHLSKKIDRTVFPGFQGSANHRKIIAMAVMFHQARQPEMVESRRKICEGAKILSKSLQDLGYNILGGGTDSHMVVIDLRDETVDGAKVEKVLELAHISCNRNLIPGDIAGGSRQSGLRLGTSPMVTRGTHPWMFAEIASLVHMGINITRVWSEEAAKVATQQGYDMPFAFKHFESYANAHVASPELEALRRAAEVIAEAHPLPF